MENNGKYLIKIENEVKFYVLCELSMDWLGLSDFIGLVSDALGEVKKDVLIDTSIYLLRKLMEEGIIEPGYVEEDFVAWKDSMEPSIQYITSELNKIEYIFSLMPGQICWLNCPPSLDLFVKFLSEKYHSNDIDLKEVYKKEEEVIVKEDFLELESVICNTRPTRTR